MDFREKAFGQASEASKLITTLSTALVAFGVTLVNFKETEVTLLSPRTGSAKVLLSASLLLFLLATASGVWTQLALVDVLSKGNESAPSSPWSGKITFPFCLQITVFLLGSLVLVSYVIARIFG